MKNFVGTAVLLCLVACDLMHCEQRTYCLRADGDPDRCAARPDWCVSSGGPECAGSCPGRFCSADPAQKRCVLDDQAASSCPLDTRFIDGDQVVDLKRFKWMYDRLSPAGRSLSGQKLVRPAVEDLPVEDRRQLCGANPGDPCELHWDTERGYARCMLVGEVCAGCEYRVQPFKCYAKNLCSGVICP